MAEISKRLMALRGAAVALPLCFLLTSCSDGGVGNAQLVSIFLNPTTQVMDAGQTTQVTASLTNDSNSGGATFSVTGGGTLSSTSTTTAGTTEHVSVNYTAPATATVATVTAASVHAPSQTAAVVITVNPALTLKTSSLPTGTLGVPYDVVPSATGGTGTLAWSIASGTLPAGLSLNSSNGEIAGTPTVAGSSTFTLAVTDAAPTPMTAVQTFTLVIGAQPPVVSTSSLPVAITGSSYSQQLTYTGGGTGTAVWAISAGSLPAASGLTLSSSGLISGTPATAGVTYSFSVTVTVGTQTSAPVALTIKTVAPVAVSTKTLPDAHLNVAYSQQLAFTGGDGTTPKWALVSGSLPSTLSLSSAGLLSGTPTVAATYTIGVAVTVGTQTSATQTLTLNVLSTQISSATSASGEVGLPFAFQVTALGGTAPYTFSLGAGSNALPAGLTISASTGLISGVPTTNTGSPYSGVIVQAKDSLGAVGTASMTFTIAASRGSAANAELSGQYAFLLTGFDATGNPVDMAGSFTADGAGHISSGVVDTNGTALVAPQSNIALVASTYAVGTDGRGQLTLTTAAGSTSYVMAVSTLTSGIATGGALTQFDATGRRLSGQFFKQTASAFVLPAANTGVAFGAYGFAANSTSKAMGRSALIGEIQFSGASAIASAEVVTDAAGGAAVVPTAATIAIAANGRGTLSLTLPASAGTLNFSVYVVSSSRMLLLSSDIASGTTSSTRALLAGDAVAQTVANGAFTVATLNGTSVFHEDKLTPAATGGYTSDVQIGMYTFDGAGNITGTEDRNSGGIVSQVGLVGTYSVAANGRVSAQMGASGITGCLDCVQPSSVFYLSGTGRGYSLEFSNPGGGGSLEPQTAANYAAGSLSGSYALATDAALAPAVLPESGLVTSAGSGSVTTLLDQALPGALSPDVASTGAVTVAPNGRGVINGAAVLYLVSPTRALWLDTTTASPVVREINRQ